MATAFRSTSVRRASSATTIPQIRIPAGHDNTDSNAIPKVSYPILFFGSLGIAFLIFWHRERTKNIYQGQPILTVHPSTDADVSQVQNITNLVNWDASVLLNRFSPSNPL